MLLGNGKKTARNRMQIYMRYIEMVSDPSQYRLTKSVTFPGITGAKQDMGTFDDAAAAAAIAKAEFDAFIAVEPQEPVRTMLTDDETAALDARAAALREELARLTDDKLALVANTSPLSIPRAESKDRDDLMARIMENHPDDIAAALARWRTHAAQAAPAPASPESSTPDITYRKVDDMFTQFTCWRVVSEGSFNG